MNEENIGTNADEANLNVTRQGTSCGMGMGPGLGADTVRGAALSSGFYLGAVQQSWLSCPQASDSLACQGKDVGAVAHHGQTWSPLHA